MIDPALRPEHQDQQVVEDVPQDNVEQDGPQDDQKLEESARLALEHNKFEQECLNLQRERDRLDRERELERIRWEQERLDRERAKFHEERRLAEQEKSKEKAKDQFNKESRKIPEFWKDNPDQWFDRIETAFTRWQVTDQFERYHAVLCALPQNVTAAVGDSLSDLNLDTPYDQIKHRLLSVYRKSQFERDMEAVNIPADGSERPTFIWDKMAQSIPDGAHRAQPCSMIKSIFFAKINASIRDHIMDMKYDRFREVAEKADELWKNHKNKHEVRVMKVLDDSTPKSTTEGDELEAVNQVNHSLLEDYCYYHRMWGNQAKNCRAPCKAKNQVPKNAQRQRRN